MIVKKMLNFGLIAQDVSKILDCNNNILDKSEDFYHINYIQLIAPLIKSIQELKEEIQIIKKKIIDLQIKN